MPRSNAATALFRAKAAVARAGGAVTPAAAGGGGAPPPVGDDDDDATLPDVPPRDDDAPAPDGAAAPPPSDAEGADARVARDAALVLLSPAAIAAGALAAGAHIHLLAEGLNLLTGNDEGALVLSPLRCALANGDMGWTSPPSDELDRLRKRLRDGDAGVVLVDDYFRRAYELAVDANRLDAPPLYRVLMCSRREKGHASEYLFLLQFDGSGPLFGRSLASSRNDKSLVSLCMTHGFLEFLRVFATTPAALRV